MKKNIKIMTLTMLLAAGSAHIIEAGAMHLTIAPKPESAKSPAEGKSPTEVAKTNAEARNAQARTAAEHNAEAHNAEANKSANAAKTHSEANKNEPTKTDSLDFNESINQVKFDNLKELNDYLAKESTRPNADGSPATLLEFNTSKNQNAVDGTTKIIENYSNGTVKTTYTEPYSQAPAKIFLIHKDGTRIVTEYAHGKITRSIITRPDATEITTKYDNGKMMDSVTITKPDGTKIETEYNSKGIVSNSKTTPPQAPAPGEITLEPTLDDSAQESTIEHSDGTQEITYSPKPESKPEQEKTSSLEPIEILSILDNPNNKSLLTWRDKNIIDIRNVNLKRTINSDGSRTLTDSSYGSGDKAASITVDSNGKIIRSNDPFAKEFLRTENAPTVKAEPSAPIAKPVETATQASPQPSRAPLNKATSTKNQAVINKAVDNTMENIANQKNPSVKGLSLSFSSLFSKLGIRTSKPKIDALAKDAVKTAPKPGSSPSAKASWLQSLKQSISNMISSSKTPSASAPKAPLQ